MSNKPLVSVITIFFNAEKFFEEAIKSVLAQTYNDWELLLVDDGSTDKSTEIALEYAQRYPQNVHYLEHDHHQNRGMSATRNLGLQHARGEYLAFLDADDIWLPQCLERLVTILDSHPEARMVYGNTLYWYSWTNNSEGDQKDFSDYVAELSSQPNTLFHPPELLTLFLRDGDTVPCICSLVVQRELVEATGGFEEFFRGLYEDQVFYAKICLNATVFVTSECLAKYRQHSDSCCAISQKLEYKSLGRLLFLGWLEKYLIDKRSKNTEACKVLKEELFSLRHPILYKFRERIRSFLYQFKQIVLVVLGLNRKVQSDNG